MSCEPITDGVPLEPQLFAEELGQGVGVFAGVGLVEAVIGAHNGRSPGLDGVSERPEIEFMDSPVVDVGGYGFGPSAICLVGIRTLGLLLIGDVMFRTSLDSCVLNAVDGLRD